MLFLPLFLTRNNSFGETGVSESDFTSAPLRFPLESSKLKN